MGSDDGQHGHHNEEVSVLDRKYEPKIDGVSGDGGNGGGDSFGNGGGDGEEEGGDDKQEEKEFGPILKFEEVMKETKARGVELPSDMLEAAKSTGIRRLLLERYLDLQVRV